MGLTNGSLSCSFGANTSTQISFELVSLSKEIGVIFPVAIAIPQLSNGAIFLRACLRSAFLVLFHTGKFGTDKKVRSEQSFTALPGLAPIGGNETPLADFSPVARFSCRFWKQVERSARNFPARMQVLRLCRTKFTPAS